MSSFVENSFFWALVIGAGFLAAVAIAAFAPVYFPAVAHNGPLLQAFRCLVPLLAIVFIGRLKDALPRARIVSLQNL